MSATLVTALKQLRMSGSIATLDLRLQEAASHTQISCKAGGYRRLRLSSWPFMNGPWYVGFVENISDCL
jgi:hypothetical protein